jgi:hypothetical protein
VETMELCVTACEKFSNNNEVLPSGQVAPCSFGDPVCDRATPDPYSQLQRGLLGQARACLGSDHSPEIPMREEAGTKQSTEGPAQP